MQIYDRVPPQSPEAERAVLGACLLDSDALSIVVERLRTDDFYDLSHRSAYDVILSMYAASRPVDLVTFGESLISRGLFDNAGAQSFIASLIAEVPTTANAAFHAAIVKEKSTRRHLIDAGSRIVNLAYSGEMDNATLVDEAERLVFEVSQNNAHSDFRPVSEILTPTFQKLEARYNQKESGPGGFPSGFADLDRMITGFQPGSLNIVAARPSMGKTAFALNIAQFGGGDDTASVLIFSLEMSAEQLVQRMLAAQARVNLNMINTGTMGNRDWKALMDAAGILSQRPIFINDSSMLSCMDFRARCRRFKSRFPNLGLVIVDYLQLMTFGGRPIESRQQEVSEISRMLKGVARELDCPVIALSQLSRETEKRQTRKPQLSDLRDSGAIEQDADTVLFLYREDYYEEAQPNQDSEAQLMLSKNRNGPTGTVQLVFQREITRFFSREF